MAHQPDSFFQIIRSPFKFRWMLLTRLPAAWIAGIRLRQIDNNGCTVYVRHQWINQNPFRSMYFAVLSMAGEMSTGLPFLAAIYKRPKPVSMLVVGMQAEFYKKAVGTISFACQDGAAIFSAVDKTLETGEGQTVVCTAIGSNEGGEQVAKFVITWSVKAKL
jgi:hypothetical protein